jgi:6-phosphofructokinase 1
VSEGVSTADGKALVESLVPPEQLERDQHGNVKLSGSDLTAALEHALAEHLPGKRARVDAFGFLLRGNVGSISQTDAREAFEAGAFAVQVAGEGGGSVALQHDGSTVLARVPLADVAGKTRHMPDSFLHRQENRLSEEGYAYLKRLVPAKHKVGQPFV